ncbi:polysaccharide deacetylase family protein [Feifania hominis]|uniref:polysaccharide deacetylase family protein n=1 Tax=Feifania hominis TaxID=2763660 RepID=UPI0020160894|nr:polysaccharide deacetylase family protein [Feifania hominis]
MVVTLLVFALAVGSVVGLRFLHSNALALEPEQPQQDGRMVEQLDGTLYRYIDEQSGYLINLSYPVLGVEEVDSVISRRVFDTINSFVSYAAENPPKGDQTRPVLTLSHSMHEDDYVVYFDFTTQLTRTGSTDIEEGHFTLVFPPSLVHPEPEPEPEPEPQPEKTWPDPSKPMVALTFDDGPNATYTAAILDALKEYGGHATFFVVGTRLGGEKNQAVLRRIVDEGSEIGNHTQSHKNLAKSSVDTIRDQIQYVNDRVTEITGVTPTWLRPPYGAKNSQLSQVAGMPFAMWSIDTLDWKTKDADKTYSTTMNSVKDGSIVLMHDIHKTTIPAAVKLIRDLNAKGYQLVTVSELYEARGIDPVDGKSYFSAYK